MKFKKLNEEFTSDDLYQILIDYINDKLVEAVDNLAIEASSDIEDYDADYCSEEVNQSSQYAYNKLRQAAEYFAEFLLWNAPEVIHESLNEDVDASQFIGKPLKDFLKTIDHRTRIYIDSENGYSLSGGAESEVGGMSGLAHDVEWYLADKAIRDIQIPEDQRFYKYKILIEDCEKKDKLKESIPEKKLYADAEDIADRLSIFLNSTSRIKNLDDYLDEYDLEHLGKSMDALYDFAQAYSYEEKNESLLTEKNWKHQLPSGAKLRKAIEDEDYATLKSTLMDCYREINQLIPDDFEEYELEDKLEELEILDTEPDEEIDIDEQDVEDNWNYELDTFYDICDAYNIWIPLE